MRGKHAQARKQVHLKRVVKISSLRNSLQKASNRKQIGRQMGPGNERQQNSKLDLHTYILRERVCARVCVCVVSVLLNNCLVSL